MARTDPCQLCGSSLSKEKFDRVTRIDAARARELHKSHQRQSELQRALKQTRQEPELVFRFPL